MLEVLLWNPYSVASLAVLSMTHLAADPTGACTQPISTLNYSSIFKSISTFVSPQFIV